MSPLTAQQRQPFEARFLALVEQAETLYPVELTNIQLQFDLRGKACGKTSLHRSRNWTGSHQRLQIQLNPQACLLYPEDTLTDTLPHEVAHAVCMLLNQDRAHGPQWRAVCRALGGSGSRCAGEQIVLSPARRHQKHRYRSTCGRDVEIGPVRHRRLQAEKTVYQLRGSRGRITKNGYLGPVDSIREHPDQEPDP